MLLFYFDKQATTWHSSCKFYFIFLIGACLHEGGGSRVGKVTRFGGVTRIFM